MTIDEKAYTIGKNDFFVIKPFQKHSFKMAKDSILIGLSTEIYDPKDEYR